MHEHYLDNVAVRCQTQSNTAAKRKTQNSYTVWIHLGMVLDDAKCILLGKREAQFCVVKLLLN